MDNFEKAVAFALKAHEGQTRKTGNTPFILHPAEAAAIAATITDDRDILAAVMLHDTVEDTDTSVEDIRESFGDRVAGLVAGETEEACDGIPRAESWRYRKELSLKHLRETPDIGVKIMWLCDKLSNMRAFARSYKKEGDAMWRHFNQNDPDVHCWYYSSVARAVEELADTEAYREYTQLIDYVFSEVKHEKTDE